jgi:hypothetical protein
MEELASLSEMTCERLATVVDSQTLAVESVCCLCDVEPNMHEAGNQRSAASSEIQDRDTA